MRKQEFYKFIFVFYFLLFMFEIKYLLEVIFKEEGGCMSEVECYQ